jgi:hypothetical protein
MERVPYRRYRESKEPSYEKYGARYTRHDNHEEAGVLGETLILQGIISGAVLVVIMLISMITFAPLTPAQQALRQALSGSETVHELVEDTKQFGIETLGWSWLE